MKTKILILSIFLSVLFFAGAQALVFYPVKYKFWVAGVSTTVGKSTDLPVYVQNLGLLADNYTVNVMYIGMNPNVISIENALSQTEQLSTHNTGRTSARLTMRSSTAPITLRVYVMSNNDATYNPSSTCGSSSDCSYLGESYYCLSGKCTRFYEVIVKTGMASLPDFGLLGIIQIILLAGILALLKF